MINIDETDSGGVSAGSIHSDDVYDTGGVGAGSIHSGDSEDIGVIGCGSAVVVGVCVAGVDRVCSGSTSAPGVVVVVGAL